ncbi:6-phospho-beta-glucosidase [Baekduia soli]|uniref:6-phospho-beta-glucosidase n=1 Tax=Baekduia soli TaxID=496014 RepID=A0A5B8UC72_9ACTN|nr:6-phospho-beta-glucosidase [Baekduia soli]QEC50438.1 6-phospho-beta-glucosidase [Baekduia soli]
MKITILGGGGFRVPMLYDALLACAPRLGVDELALYDISSERLNRISVVLQGQAAASGGVLLPFTCTTRLEEALEGADFVFCAIRVGELEGRVIDERVPLNAGVVGQETTGPGGLCFALRTVPVMLELAEAVARHAPRAWFVNFTNPAGLVTEAIQGVLGGRVVGICDSPTALCRRVARALRRNPEDLWFDYFGLNHLGWLRAVRDGERDLLPDLLADDARLESFEEGRLFGGEWLRSLGMIPNEYLYFYYYASDAVGAVRSSLQSRGEFLLEQQHAFYAAGGDGPAAALHAWHATRREREARYMEEARSAAGLDGRDEHEMDAGGYEGEAIAVVEAIARNQGRVLILNTANASSLPFLDAGAVVEVPCIAGSTGIVPTAVGDVPGHARGLITTIKDVERTTIEAAVSGSRELAVQAIALHPLVPSVTVARRIFDAYSAQHPQLRHSLR